MEDVYIIGVGMTPFGRHLDKSLKKLVVWALNDALSDAGIDKSEIQAAFFGNAVQGFMEGQTCIRGQVALLPEGLHGIPVFNVENACATASSAFNLAVNHLRAGAGEVALAIGAEKMYDEDKAKMFAIFDSGWDVHTPKENADRLIALGQGIDPPPGSVSDRPYSVFMDVYAALGRQLMRLHDITQEQMAFVAAKNHTHAVDNERAQYRKSMTADEVLAGRAISYPLTLPMCAPISDGAAAAIVCTGAALKRLGVQASRAVKVRASVIRSATARGGDDLENHITRLTARAAYEQAGVAPEDVDVVEVHDATAIGELIQSANLGLCELGAAGKFAQSGATTLGGRVPINPSGGLESKGHPIGATGIGQIFELVAQLRGEAGSRQVEKARIAVQENGGGLWGFEEAVAHIAVFERSVA
jgi:acetyl-CoA acyltransferase